MNQWLADRIDQEITRWQQTPPAVLLYLGVAILAAFYLIPLFAIDYFWQILTFAVVLTGIGLYRRWLIPLMLLLLITNQLVAEVPISIGPYFGLYDLTIALAVLTFVVAASRYVVLAGTPVSYYQGTWFERLATPFRQMLARWRNPAPLGISPRDPATFRMAELITGAIRIVAAVIVAAAILSAFPLDPRAGQRTGIIPTVSRTVELAATLTIAAIVIHFVIDTFCWRFLSRRQARMFLRREVTSDYAADLGRMARYQIKGRKKRIAS